MIYLFAWLLAGLLAIGIIVIPPTVFDIDGDGGIPVTYKDMLFFIVLLIGGILSLMICIYILWDEHLSDKYEYWWYHFKQRISKFMDRPVPFLKWLKM